MKKYFITGVSGGLGLELMKKLVAQGDFVYGVSRKKIPEDSMPITSKDKWIWRSCDVTRDSEIQASIEHQKSIDFMPEIVILNAGLHSRDEVGFDVSQYKKLFQVNCFGALRWVQAYLESFTQRDRGHFVYISSLAVFYPSPTGANYSTTKAYTSMIFESLKKKYQYTGISFSVFYPGFIETDMSSQSPVPSFLKLPVSTAARKILNILPKGSQSVRFPMRSILLLWFLALVPSQILLAIMKKKARPR